MGMLVNITKTMGTPEQGKMFEWLFDEFGSPTLGRWRLVNLASIEFNNMEDGVYFKLVWNHI